MSWRRPPGRLALALGLATRGATTRDTLGVTQCFLTTGQELVFFFKANLVTVYCTHRGVALAQRAQFSTV